MGWKSNRTDRARTKHLRKGTSFRGEEDFQKAIRLGKEEEGSFRSRQVSEDELRIDEERGGSRGH